MYGNQEYPRVNVLYNYVAQDSNQMSLRVGQTITVMEQDDSGWWDGYNEFTGERGLFPSTYVQWMEEEYQADFGPAYKPPQKTRGGKKNDYEMAGYQQQYGGQKMGAGMDASSFNQEVKIPLVEGKARGGDREEKGGKGGRGEKVPSCNTRFGFYAVNWSRLNGFTLFFVGVFSLYTSFIANTQFGLGNLFQTFQMGIFAFAVLLGAGVFIYESMRKAYTLEAFPWRSYFYFIVALPLFVTTYTVFNGVAFLIAAIFFYEAYRRKEQVASPKADSGEKHGMCSNGCFPCGYLDAKRREGKCGKEVFTYSFVLINIAVFFWGYLLNVATFAPTGTLPQFTLYVPYAKGFGYGLDMTCAIIVLPVCRTFIRALYDASTQNQTTSSRFIRAILWLFPLDKALHFHEKLGFLILFFSFGHSFSHLINAGLRWPQVIAFYGWSPLLSGFLLWVVIFFMFPATPRNVKAGQFEIFWYSHQLFWLFFILNLIHGRNTLGPNYWKWFILPGAIYMAERIYREYSAYQTVSIVSITNMKNNVISIEFSKAAFPNGYLEGQYCYIQCPSISRGQWHPFTISSAPGDPTVTLHIKILGKNSWTRQLADYFAFMGPKNASYFELADVGAGGVQIGKTTGPSGERMLVVYGPHSAPTQHCPEYPVDIIAGSGIGVTPVSATMQQIVFYRWKYNIGDSNPDHAYFAWVCNYNELEYFRWMVRTVKECQDEVFDLRLKSPDTMGVKTFEVHIYLTSAPETMKPQTVEVDDDIGFWGRPRKPNKGVQKAPEQFSEVEIYEAMLNCPKGKPTIIGDIHIYNGRPKWEELFRTVSERHLASNVGVAFCGNPKIGDDLQKNCREFTRPDANQFFVLHKENF